MREQYQAVKQLLQFDLRCHEQMAEFQEMFHHGQPEDYARIRQRFSQFSADVSNMVDALETLNPSIASPLRDYHRKFDFYTRFLLAPPKVDSNPPYTHNLNDLTGNETDIGNKACHLALLQKELELPVPKGFVINAKGYHHLIEDNNLREIIDEHLAQLSINSSQSLQTTSESITALIKDSSVPTDLECEIISSFDALFQYEPHTSVAVRSSGLGEDGESSFAGQFTTVLHVKSENLLSAYKAVLASKYSPEALYYRIHQGWGDEETAMSVLIMPMVSAQLSGVLYTGDVLQRKNHQNYMQLHVVPGIGEQLVGGETTPEKYLLNRKPPYTPSIDEKKYSLTEPLLNQLAFNALRIEEFFGSLQDIEWAIDDKGQLFFLQARNLHQSRPQVEPEGICTDLFRDQIVVTGAEGASSGIAAGAIYKLDKTHSIDNIPAGAVLVTEKIPPEYVKVLHKVAAVICKTGSRASHFATVSREFGVPLLSGIRQSYELFTTGDNITVDGYSGTVYRGIIKEIIVALPRPSAGEKYQRIISEASKFITSLELIDPSASNFTPEGCRSMHDIIRFCHEKALHTLFSVGKPGSAIGSIRLQADIPLDVYLFDIGSGVVEDCSNARSLPLDQVTSVPFHAIWRGLSHHDVQWKEKPFDWEAYDRIELSGGVPPKKDSFAFASYAVIGSDYLHFNLRFGYHFTIVDALCGANNSENHCMLRFAGGGADFDHRSLRIDFLQRVLERLNFTVEKKGDLLEAKLQGLSQEILTEKLDLLGRLLGATQLMDMILENEQMVQNCVDDFFNGRYSFSENG